jgi:hypothetical protein
MDLYEPLDVPKPVARDVWIVDGPAIQMALPLGSLPFPTRMAVIRLTSGDLFLHSPIALHEDLARAVEALGRVRHLVSPNRLHYAFIPDWKRRFPEARTWASPGVRERAASQGIEIAFDADLADRPDPAWSLDIDQLVFRGSRIVEEVVFFHRESRTLVLADLVESFEPRRFSRAWRPFLRLARVADPDGQTPLDLRLSFLGRARSARESFARVRAWEPERVILAHGRWYAENGKAELDRAFRWLR